MEWYKGYYDWRENRIVNWFEVEKLGKWGVCIEPFPLFYFFTNNNEADDMLEEAKYQWEQYARRNGVR